MADEKTDWTNLISDAPTQEVLRIIRAAKSGQQIEAGKAADRLKALIEAGEFPDLHKGRDFIPEVLAMALDIQEPKG